MALHFIILLLLAALTGAQLDDPNERRVPRTSALIATGALFCPCSPTKRGFLPAARADLANALITALASRDIETADAALHEAYDACVARFSHEDCVNAAAGLHNIDSFCVHLKDDGRNLYDASDDPALLRTVDLCNASESSERNVDDDTEPAPEPIVSKPRAPPTPVTAEKFPAPPPSVETPPAKAPVEETVTTPDTPANVTEPVVSDNSTSPVTPPSDGNPSIPAPVAPEKPPTAATSTAPPPRTPVNEGCIAIEHLSGALLQHRRHLRRRVLCGRGVCATPNHALIVDGEWTSMRQLCASRWTCVHDTRLVNNLKIARGAPRRRVLVEGIVATPYDIRFPRALSWLAQMAEDALYGLTSTADAVAGFATTIVAVRS